MRRTLLIPLLLLTAWASLAGALPSAPPTFVLDQTGLIPDAQEKVIAQNLALFEERTGIQMLVAVLADLESDAQDDATRIYEAWGIGKKGQDRGVLFCIWPTARQTRIEVGYGLEGELTDLESGRLLRRMLELPRDDPAGRVAFVLTGIAQEIAPDDPLARGEWQGLQTRRAKRDDDGFDLGDLIWLIIVFAMIGGGGAGRNRWLGPLIIASNLSGGGSRRGGGGFGGGGGGGFGGFSGGGGLSGGGGASGGW
ncbi:TPM domain-containing protein [bacterium]|nr:TPM domain-containing protein [bacterium]